MVGGQKIDMLEEDSPRDLNHHHADCSGARLKTGALHFYATEAAGHYRRRREPGAANALRPGSHN